MTTIKGPITINRNNYAKVLEEHGIMVKMPFTAEGFKCDHVPERTDLTGIDVVEVGGKPYGSATKAPKAIVAPIETPVIPAERLVEEVVIEAPVKSTKKETKKKKRSIF